MTDSFVGQKIKEIRPMTKAELKAEYWGEDRFNVPVVVELENGAKLYASCDPEGNRPGGYVCCGRQGQANSIRFCKEQVMSDEFFKTRMGRIFYEGTAPRIAEALERIAEAIEEQNRLACIAVGKPEEEETD